MMQLLRLELAKLRPAKYFRVLFILWLVGFLALPMGAQALLMFLADKMGTIGDIELTADLIPIFDFVDIWQNLGSVYRYFSIFLSFLVIISVCNEYTYKTIRQNVLDGLSKREYLTSKVMFAGWIAVAAGVLTLIFGTILGLIFSPVKDLGSILSHIAFIPAYALHVFQFLLFSMTIAFLIRRSGLTIALVIFWTYIFDPILNAFFLGYLKTPWLSHLLPTESSWLLVPLPFQKMVTWQIQDYVSWTSVGASVLWCAFLIWAMWALISRRDLT